jgi:DNA-binding MarR family transcriptional regulator/tetratricopeptide (TPR) repeat protein
MTGTREVEVVVALRPHSVRRNDLVVPYWVSQEGLAESGGLDRGNLSRILKRLIARGLVAERRAFVEGADGARKVYFLTQAGDRAADKLVSRGSGAVVHPADLPSPRIVGREGELARLAAWHESDACRVLVVHGMAGIGKTTLLHAFARAAAGRGPVFYHRVREWTSPAHVLRELGGFLSLQRRRGLREYLESAAVADGGVDRGTGIFHFERDCRAARALVILDDLHLASRDLREFAGALSEAAARSGGATLVASRHPVDPFGHRAFVSHSAREMRLGGLDRGAFRALALSDPKVADSNADAIALERIYRATGGNPLFLGLLSRGGLKASPRRSGAIASFVSREIFASLPKEERELLAGLAVFRGPVPESALSGVPEAGALDSLVDRSLVERGPEAGVLRLHDLVREIAEAAASPGLSRRWHHIAASCYESSNAPWARLEYLRHSVLSGRAAALGALLPDAWHALVREGLARPLIEVIDGDHGSSKDAGLLLVKGGCLESLGLASEAAAVYSAGLRCRPDASVSLMLWRGLAHALAVGGDQRAAQSACRKALAAAARVRGREAEEVRLRIRMILGSLQSRELRLEESESTDIECLREARRLGLRLDAALCLNNLGVVRARLGRDHEAIPAFRESLSILAKLGERQAWAHVSANLGASLDVVGHRGIAMSALGDGLREAERLGDTRVVGVACEYLALAHARRGEAAVAEAYCVRAEEAAKRSRNARRLAVTGLAAGIVRCLGGRGREAIAPIVAARRLARGLHELDVVFWGGFWLARLMATLGRTAAASKAAEECRRLIPGRPPARFEAALLSAAASIADSRGDRSASRRLRDRAAATMGREKLTGIETLLLGAPGGGARSPSKRQND